MDVTRTYTPVQRKDARVLVRQGIGVKAVVNNKEISWECVKCSLKIKISMNSHADGLERSEEVLIIAMKRFEKNHLMLDHKIGDRRS